MIEKTEADLISLIILCLFCALYLFIAKSVNKHKEYKKSKDHDIRKKENRND